MSAIAQSLLHPFAAGLLEPPAPGRGFFLRAEPLEPFWRGLVTCEQSDRPAFDRLRAAGFTATRRLSEGRFELGLVALTKHKAESQANLARAWQLLAPGGMLVAAGAKDSGAASLARELEAAVGPVEALSKYHHRILLARRQQGPDALPWLEAAELRPVAAIGGAVSRPGIYGWDKIDAGSALLAAQFSPAIQGRVADLGAGWGYLGLQLGRLCPGVTALDAIEAEGLAVEAAEANLTALPQARVLWQDATAGLEPGAYDWVVMNPPFHSGKATDMDLGRAFVASAAEGLKPGGRLLMVANRHLPYEAELGTRFSAWRVVAEDRAFKVLEARR